MITTPARPPPWPNKPHVSPPISSTSRSRPPPWPIIPFRAKKTPRKRRNAKHWFKAKSRAISHKYSDTDKVFLLTYAFPYSHIHHNNPDLCTLPYPATSPYLQPPLSFSYTPHSTYTFLSVSVSSFAV